MTDYEFVGDSDAFAREGQSKSTWDTCQQHREIITKLLSRMAGKGRQSLCVLGAGPCNDIQLNVLASLFNDVALVDIDSTVLHTGVENQKLDDSAKVRLLGNHDLFAASTLLKQYQADNDESLIERILQTIATHEPEGIGTHDCVVSTCMLSQLLFEASDAIDKKHIRFVDILKAIRLRHLQIMFSAIKPGGHGILVTDFVSSESLPDLLQDDVDLKATLRRAIANQNFLHGLNPPMITKVLQGEEFAGQLASLKVSEPWRWVLPGRTYACFAIEFMKSK